MTTTLQKLCENHGIIAARCQYFGEPHPYIVDGMMSGMSDSGVVWHQDLIASALQMAHSLSELDEFEFRVILPGGNTILVIAHPNLKKCYIAVTYRAGSKISKSVRRMVRRQFKHFKSCSIEVEPGEIRLGDNPLQVPTHFEGN